MNKIAKYMLGAAMMTTAFTACSPDEFDGADPNKVPTTEGITITSSVDQETNTVTASVPEINGQWPVWYLDGAFYSTQPTIAYSSMTAGTHTLEVKVGNRNGFSASTVNGSFTFNETKVDYSPYFNRLCNKSWRVMREEKGHMGCGPDGTDGSSWWVAGVNEKVDNGLYDDVLTFTHSDSDPASGGSYTYNPGEDGLTFANNGVSTSYFAGLSDGSNDFDAPTEVQNTTFTLVPGTWTHADGDNVVTDECLYLQLPKNTLIPYISNDAQLENPYFRIESLSNTKLALVYDIPGTIAWRLVLTSKEYVEPGDEPETPGAVFDWNPAATSNLWKAVEDESAFVNMTTWFADNGWQGLPTQPTPAHDAENGVWSVTVPEGTGASQWQGQWAIHTTVGASMTKAYDFFLVVESDEDIAGMTIKLTQAGGGEADNNFFTADRHDIAGGKENVFKFEGVRLITGDADALDLVFDLGGAPAGTNVKVSKIYLAEAVAMSYNDEDNLWKAVDEGSAFRSVTPWFADGGWAQVADPEWSHEGNVWMLSNIQPGPSQWQGQFPINTTLSADADTEYNFACTIESDEDLAGVTIKLTQTDGDDGTKNDNNFFFADQHNVTGGTPYTYKAMGVKLPQGAADRLSLFLDFGGSTPGATVKIKDIVFKKAN